MRKRVLALILLLPLLVGCATIGGDGPRPDGGSKPPEAASGRGLDYPRDQAVLQVAHGGGLVIISRVSEMIPDVTIWGDGRVVFAARDGTVRAGRLQPETVDRLIDAAAFLYDLDAHYAAVSHTDAPSATFTVLTERGAKTVSVYGLDPVQQQEDEPEPTVFARLRDLWAQVHEALPVDAPEMEPAVVYISTWPSEDEATAEWPPELQGRLTGEEARRAVALAGLGEAKTFRVGDKPQRVLVVPVLPRPGDRESSYVENPGSAPEHPPGLDADGPNPVPEQLSGRGEDETLALDVTARRQPDGQYLITTTVANKAPHGIDLLFDCGSLLRLEGLRRVPTKEDEGFGCPAVYSRWLPPGATDRLEQTLAPEAVANWSGLAVVVRYEVRRNGRPIATRQVKAELRPGVTTSE